MKYKILKTINKGAIKINEEQICYISDNKQDSNIKTIVMSCGTTFDVLEDELNNFIKK